MLTLRLDDRLGQLVLTTPPGMSERRLRAFLNDQSDWIDARLSEVAERPRVHCGGQILWCGQPHTLVFDASAPRRVVVAGGRVTVGGPCEMAPARLEAHMRKVARSHFTALAQEAADALGTRFSRLGIGDMKSRWASCSCSAGLKFSFRLMMAPSDVQQYVAVHEVAHLLEMNHSPRFWAHVERVIPNWKPRRNWLKTHGRQLQQMQFAPAE